MVAFIEPSERRSTASSALRRMVPRCKAPLPAVLARFTPAEQERLLQRTAEPIECFFEPRFARRETEREVLDFVIPAVWVPRLPDLDAGDTLPRVPRRRSLTQMEEQSLFTRFNYARYRMQTILKRFRGRRLGLSAARELIRWDDVALQARDAIVQANLGLIPAMIERSRNVAVDFGELLSEGQFALIRSAYKFDCSRGFRFSTYACRAILTSFTRASMGQVRYRDRFPAEFDPDFQRSDSLERRREETEQDYVDTLVELLKNNSAGLSKVELRVLAERFGIASYLPKGSDAEQKTLREVADEFGVTKERVRQIQNKAMAKLREAIEQNVHAA
ncbi:MAG: sigma-70 family RNA polymerase sigma factor [Phycisphaerae bacterium]